MQRERKTLRLMVGIYCRAHHGGAAMPCSECESLIAYAMHRIDRCIFQASKPTCAKCPIHCYAPAWRERVRGVMRYAGPRMLLHHPILALLHLVDGFRSTPPRPEKRAHPAEHEDTPDNPTQGAQETQSQGS